MLAAPSSRLCLVAAVAAASFAALWFSSSSSSPLFLVPALYAETLPPVAVFWPVIGVMAFLDSLLRAVTPPNLYLFRELMGYVHTVEIGAAADLGLADALAAGPLTAAALAPLAAPLCAGERADGPAGCAAVALRLTRLLRALAAYGVFAEDGDGRWRNTAASAFLRSASPLSLRATALNFAGVQYRMLGDLPAALRSGESSFSRTHDGASFWPWYDAHPDSHAIFDETMRELGVLGGADAAIARDVPWGTRAAALVDVGGGYGGMLDRKSVV